MPPSMLSRTFLFGQPATRASAQSARRASPPLMKTVCKGVPSIVHDPFNKTFYDWKFMQHCPDITFKTTTRKLWLQLCYRPFPTEEMSLLLGPIPLSIALKFDEDVDKGDEIITRTLRWLIRIPFYNYDSLHASTVKIDYTTTKRNNYYMWFY